MPTEDSALYLSTPQAAAALGVSVSTVKRWVDAGILPAHRTVGGHRKLLRSEVLALVRQGDLPRGDLTALTSLATTDSAIDLEVATDELVTALLEGQGTEVHALIRRVYDSGVAIETLADRFIAPALARVGHGWEIGTIDVWQEHRGTQLCAAALYDLKNDLEARAEKNRPRAVGAAPEGDPYLLPSLLAQFVLLDAGWEAVNLGPTTPLPSLAEAIRELRPRLLWLSVSFIADESAFLDAYKALYQVAQRQGVAVAVGGRALKEPLRSAIPYTTYGDGLEHLAAFARTLHPRPKPPRRGRPPMLQASGHRAPQHAN
ncbi:MAG: helix-turn-helix domain-containing protein [Gemmataceae bacterium]|nr:helix-turn-helix domain-containing protein [Gemmataceae bacterium]